jgi:transcription-repair coupling factor (superfamily II helicase)
MSPVLTQLQQLLFSGANQGALNSIIDCLRLSRTSTPPSDSSVPPALHCEAHGSWGSLGRLAAALISSNLNRPLLFITAHIPDADQAQDDLETFADRAIHLFPAAETHETEPDPTSEVASERLRLCKFLAEDVSDNTIIVASIPALMQPVPSFHFLTGQSLTLAAGQFPAADKKNKTASSSPLDGPETVTRWLVENEFARVDQVDLVGEFASRGGIIDIFPPGQDQPVRIEFFGDQIESLRFFDLDTQRSIDTIDSISITTCKTALQTTDSTTLFSYLPAHTLVIMEETPEIMEIGRIFLNRLTDPKNIFPVEAVLQHAHNHDTCRINRFPSDTSDHSFALQAQSIQRFENRSAEALDELVDTAQQNQVFFFCENPAQQQRIREILASEHSAPSADSRTKKKKTGSVPPHLYLPVGFIHHGFALPQHHLIVLSHHELFGQHQPRRRIRRVKTIQAISSFADLEKNDLVVHVNHGIGRFRGLKTLTKNERKEEFLALEFAGKATVHVPASKIYLVHKYVGCRTGRIKLSKLGGRSWERQKQKVTEAVEDMAGELLEIQAFRETAPGIAHPPDTDWQREFEESFPYQDTLDQVSANYDIKHDMQKTNPMDRLLCGDVGYGKTELALRGAFKAVESGKQVALLVPTTILAQQHYRTFIERLADFPFIVEVLSRFKTATQARDIITRAARGQVDILIGTHRILSEDVHFKDLGLIIIDEEQRFGVEHKERLKKMRKTVDVLTMTATPIPRTLHMALLGIRDISSLTTPPLDRRSIVTEVCPHHPDLIRAAILRELARDGQIYFVHNRVHNIISVSDKIKQLVPEARIITAHGQMPRHELESRMLEFVNNKADVLVCTTIIESGLDIPNANTIFINDADRFGLAELHQLRGRVGRYKNRAFAYMLLPTRRGINPIAAKRLKAIEEYSQLGSGFRIALRDLEIRGAGNILGVQQSGHIDAVGYELYCQLLATAVRRLQDQPEPVKPTTHLELQLDCHIPRSYISSERQRMDVYRRLATCAARDELEQLEKDLCDLFGKPPKPVLDLMQLAEIRILASQASIRSIVQKEPDLIFSVDNIKDAQSLFDDRPGRISLPDDHTIHLRLAPNYFDTPSTLLAVLRKILMVS